MTPMATCYILSGWFRAGFVAFSRPLDGVLEVMKVLSSCPPLSPTLLVRVGKRISIEMR